MAELQLAKFSRPRIRHAVPRERLFASLDRLREHPVVWIAAEPGAGKTTLLSSYLEARKVPCLWYHVDSGDADPASFFYHLGLAAQSLKRRKAAGAPLPLLTPDQGADLAGFSRRYFRELYARMGVGAALVLDNLHEAPEDTALHRVLAAAFEEAPEGVCSLVASRTEPPSAYTQLIARDRFAFVEAGDIRLTLEETGEIVHERAELGADAVRRLHDQSGGWAAGLTLLVERARRGEPVEEAQGRGALQPVFAFFAEQLIAQDFRDDTDTLLELAVVPRVTAEFAQKLTGNPKAGTLLEKLHRRHLFTQRRVIAGKPSYELHALLRAYLHDRARQEWSAQRRDELTARAARLLEAEGSLEEAIALYRSLGDWEGITRLALEAAQKLIWQGRRRTLREWISAIPAERKDAEPRLRLWQGIALAQDAPREAREELLRAHACFERARDLFHCVIAATNIVYTYYLDMAELGDMDPWIHEINAYLDSGAPFPAPTLEMYVLATQLFALGFRMPDAARIQRCSSRLFELMEHPGIAVSPLVSSASILLFDCYHHTNIEAARRLVTMVQPRVDSPECPPVPRALWFTQVGFLHTTCGDPASAVRAFETAARIGAENSLSIPLIDVYASFGLAIAAVLARDFARAEQHRQRGEVHYRSFRRIDVAASAMLKGVLASHRGDFDAARGYADEHYEVSIEAGILWQAHNALLHCAFVAVEQGQHDDADEALRRARQLVDGTAFERFTHQSDLIEAYSCLRSGDPVRMRELLASGLAGGRTDMATGFMLLQPNLLPRLFAAALAEGIEADHVRKAIHELRIPPPDPYVEGWPWPLAVRTLGGFEVRREGQPLEFSRKAPKKTLALLKAIIALGGTNVREQSLLDALWPDEEGDAASKSLGATVLRLRALLDDPEAVIQQGGTLSLDRQRVWVDAWAFEHADKLHLYRGAFLPEEEGAPWTVAMRERLRARFIHKAGDEGERLERAGELDAAIELYLRGLDADSIVEPFYQGLMRCYDRLDRRAEALATYRRLRQILSVTLGLAPSATTEKLYKSLKS